MFETFRDFIKQIIYRCCRFKDSAYFRLFELMYLVNPSAFPDVFKVPEADGYLIANFSNPKLTSYQGKEVAFINSYQFAIFWLPGVLPRATGNAEAGDYTTRLSGYCLRSPIEMAFSKKDQHIYIRKINIGVSEDEAIALKGCLLSYRLIEHELKYLVLSELVHNKKQYVEQGSNVNQELSDSIIQAVLSIPDEQVVAAIKEQAAL